MPEHDVPSKVRMWRGGGGQGLRGRPHPEEARPLRSLPKPYHLVFKLIGTHRPSCATGNTRTPKLSLDLIHLKCSAFETYVGIFSLLRPDTWMYVCSSCQFSLIILFISLPLTELQEYSVTGRMLVFHLIRCLY